MAKKKRKRQRRRPPAKSRPRRDYSINKPPLAKPKELQMGVDCPSPNMVEEETRVAVLQATVQHYLPEFAQSVAAGKAKDHDMVLIHQDAFAAGYDDDEYMLLGMAIKYAGLDGVAITITGKNHATF